jgi:hypothetical protein
VIAFINCEEGVEARTQALETASVAGGGILHGLEEQELIDYLGKALADGQLSEGRVTEKKFIEVLKNVPKVAMTEREARTIVTSVNKSEEVRRKEEKRRKKKKKEEKRRKKHQK